MAPARRPKPKPTAGTVTVTPNPAAVGSYVVATGGHIADDGSHAVWIKWRNQVGTTYQGAALLPDGSFQSQRDIYVPGAWAVEVYEGFGGPRAALLASTEFSAA